MALPTDLGVNDAGFLLQVVDYGHLMRWSGTLWEFAPGDAGSGFLRDCVIPPQDEGWALCDGQTTSYLRSGGATLYATRFTTPNEGAAGVYHESIGVYTGTVQDAVAPTISGTTATEAAHTHGVTVPAQTSGAESGHTHEVNPPSTTSGNDSGAGQEVQSGLGVTVAARPHTHDTDIGAFASGAGSAHDHAVAAQTVTSAVGSAHSHGTGSLVASATGEPARLGVLRFFRR